MGTATAATIAKLDGGNTGHLAEEGGVDGSIHYVRSGKSARCESGSNDDDSADGEPPLRRRSHRKPASTLAADAAVRLAIETVSVNSSQELKPAER
jgi:hypothetical protein